MFKHLLALAAILATTDGGADGGAATDTAPADSGPGDIGQPRGRYTVSTATSHDGPNAHPSDSARQAASDRMGKVAAAVPSEFADEVAQLRKMISGLANVGHVLEDRLNSELYGEDVPTPQNARDLADKWFRESSSIADSDFRKTEKAIDNFEARLRKAAMPAPPKSSTDQIAGRQVIDMIVGDATNLDAVRAFERLAASNDPNVLNQVTSEYGRALAQNRGVPDESWAEIEAAVIEAVAAGRAGHKGTPRQRAAKAAQAIKEDGAAAWMNARQASTIKLRQIQNRHRLG